MLCCGESPPCLRRKVIVLTFREQSRSSSQVRGKAAQFRHASCSLCDEGHECLSVTYNAYSDWNTGTRSRGGEGILASHPGFGLNLAERQGTPLFQPQGRLCVMCVVVCACAWCVRAYVGAYVGAYGCVSVGWLIRFTLPPGSAQHRRVMIFWELVRVVN
jgi:hypothetical protein